MSVERGTARRLRRRLIPNDLPALNSHGPQPHDLDEDGTCVHCGFDAVEEYHLRVTVVPEHARERRPDWAVYCERRPWVKRA